MDDAPLKDTDKLYRFISFPSFIDLVETKELRFSHPLSWKDHYEGYLIQALLYPEGIKQIEYILKTNQSLFECKKIDFIINFLQFRLCQCWTLNEENVIMWESYSHNNSSIRIETTVSELKKISTDCKKVTYIELQNLLEELKLFFPAKGKINSESIFFRKRKLFVHEQEVRVFTLPNNLKNKTLIVQANNNQSIEDPKLLIDNLKKLETRISIKDSPSFIRSVMLHPEASRWMENAVQHYCDNRSLYFYGRSKILEPEFNKQK